MVFNMKDESKRKEVKQLVYLLAMVWILSIVIWAYIFYLGAYSFQITYLISLIPLILIPFVIFGLWSFKKWGLTLGYILAIIILIESILAPNIIGVIIWVIVLYYLYKSKSIFS
jgi:hypothetical protein